MGPCSPIQCRDCTLTQAVPATLRQRVSQRLIARIKATARAMPAPGCQVIGAGWCRTGTSSLQVALHTLGYAPCFHSRLIPYLPELRDACYDYCTGRTRAFPTRHVFRQYRAAVDLPAALIPLLLDAYPDAKVRPGSGQLRTLSI